MELSLEAFGFRLKATPLVWGIRFKSQKRPKGQLLKQADPQTINNMIMMIIIVMMIGLQATLRGQSQVCRSWLYTNPPKNHWRWWRRWRWWWWWWWWWWWRRSKTIKMCRKFECEDFGRMNIIAKRGQACAKIWIGAGFVFLFNLYRTRAEDHQRRTRSRGCNNSYNEWETKSDLNGSDVLSTRAATHT